MPAVRRTYDTDRSSVLMPPSEGNLPASSPADTDVTDQSPAIAASIDALPDPLEALAPRGASRRLLRQVLGSDIRRLWLAGGVVLLQQAAGLAGPLLVAVTIDRAIPALRGDDPTPLVAIAVAYAICTFAAGLLQNVFVRLSVRVGQNALSVLRMRIFTHIQAQGVAFHESHASGALASRATNDVEAVRELFESGVEEIVTAVVSLFYISAVLLLLDWRLGLAALAALVPIYGTMRSFRSRSLQVYHRRSTAAAAVAGDMSETFAGIRTVQAFQRESTNEARFAVLNELHRKQNQRAGIEMARYVTWSRLVANTAVAALVFWGGYRVASGTLGLGIYAGVVLYLRDLYDKPLRLGGVLDTYQSAAASLGRIASLLAIEPTVVEPTNTTALPALADLMVGRRVSFRAVNFAYRHDRQVFRDFDLEVPAGQTIALIGPSGGGKSTLAKLLTRFYDPTGGQVFIDGVNLRSLSTSQLRSAVVILPQENTLFPGTVAQNIALARPDASLQDIQGAAEATGAHRFISTLRDGYETDVGSGGGRFSAGQRQLIALARVFLVNPSVIVLDEATSAIDIPSERAVQEAMRVVLHGRTALVIAHRLSTIQIADRVLVLADGCVVEDCSAADLVSGRGQSAVARRLWLERNH